MSTHVVETKVSNLKINKLTQAQYADAIQQGLIGNNELSIITDIVDGTVTEMPTPSAAYIDTIVQFAGVTDANYTNGYFYKCVSDGQSPATYSWENIEVQPAGDSLPDQTGNAGKFLTTDGTDASWTSLTQTPATMPILAVADWILDSDINKYTQTVNVTGVTSTNTVFVAPSPVNEAEYAECGCLCIGQASGTLIFRCDVVPANALTVNVIIMQ